MQVSYYNIERALWEPLIEPVEVLKDYQYKHVPWELKMEVKCAFSYNSESFFFSKYLLPANFFVDCKHTID